MKDVLRQALDAACNAAGEVPAAVLELRDGAGGGAVTASKRDELLAKLAAGEYVELEVDILAFEQEGGKRNRKNVRFRDGALLALGTSGRATPFLRDHEQGNVLARGGTISGSKTTKVAEGHYQIHQTVKATVPWAVDGLLRGTIDRFSIGWRPTGDVMCSVCNKPVFSVCYHYPGDRLRAQVGEDGVKRHLRDRAGDVTVEWIFTSAELVETSAVSVPAVPSAHIEGIRAALSALHENRGEEPQEKHMDRLRTALAAILGLAATVGEDEVIEAVKTDRAKLSAVEAQNGELKRLQAKSAAEAEAMRAAADHRELEEFIASGIAAGKVIPGSKQEESLRSYFKIDKTGAADLLASSPRVTPVREERQSKGDGPAPPDASKLGTVDEGLRQIGATPAGVRKVLAQLGSKPGVVLEKYGALALGLTTGEEV